MLEAWKGRAPETFSLDDPKLQRILRNMKRMGLENSIIRRYDRCFHGGSVGQRLPLSYRLNCATNTVRLANPAPVA